CCSKVPRIPRRPAAIDREHVAVHVTVLRVGEKEGGDGDLVASAWPAQGYVIEHALDVLAEPAVFAVKQLLGAGSKCRARSNAVTQDAQWPQLQGHGLGEIDHARLGGDEGTLQAQRNQTRDRSDIDNAARLLATHESGGLLADLKDPGQVNRHYAIPLPAGKF